MKRAALRVARLKPGSWLLRKFWRWLPLNHLMKLLQESEHWQAFQHPQPDYAFHLLLLPREPYHNLQELSQAEANVAEDLFQFVNGMVNDDQLQSRGYRLITNGGKFQQVGLLHFHLVADNIDHHMQE